jgi:hypothetical protein
VKNKTDMVLLDVGTGASEELPRAIRQPFKDGRYSDVVKNKVTNIDSDQIFLFCQWYVIAPSCDLLFQSCAW